MMTMIIKFTDKIDMKSIAMIILSLIPLFAMAQEPQIIGGFLLDGKDSF